MGVHRDVSTSIREWPLLNPYRFTSVGPPSINKIQCSLFVCLFISPPHTLQKKQNKSTNSPNFKDHRAGWLVRTEQLARTIRVLHLKEEISLHNGILFKSQRIPNAIRPEIISRSHASHLGIETRLGKARDAVVCPGTNSEIKEAIAK